MSITVNIYYKGENGNARKFAKEMQDSGLVDKIRAEKGNLRYRYFYPADDEETVLLIDSWQDESCLGEHHQSSMMKEIASLREKYDLHMTVEKFTSLKGEEEDERFIRK